MADVLRSKGADEGQQLTDDAILGGAIVDVTEMEIEGLPASNLGPMRPLSLSTRLSPSLPHAALQTTDVCAPLFSSNILRSPFNSFQALDAYVQSQKALLARTQSDLVRLRRIRDQAATCPDVFFDSLDEKVSPSSLAQTPCSLT